MKSFIPFALLVGCMLLTTATPLSHAGPVVVPGGSTVAGKTIGDWTADWWNWTGSVQGNVFSDTSGALATKNQSGPVFFIAGTQGTSVTRSFDVPGDKFLLFPLINFIVANGPDPGFSDTKTEAAALIDQGVPPGNVFANIDGTDVPDLASHREKSPVNFTYKVTNNTFTQGTFTDANSDGYWIMLQPLGSGSHTLHFGGTTNQITSPGGAFTFPSFDVNVTDNVRATGGGGTAIPLPASVWGGLFMLTLLGAVRCLRLRTAA